MTTSAPPGLGDSRWRPGAVALAAGLWFLSLLIVASVAGGPEEDATAAPTGEGDQGDELEAAEETIAALEERVGELEIALAEVETSAAEAPSEEDETGGEGQGLRNNPVPLGEPVRAGDWELVVLDVNQDAWAEVQAANQFNDPPSEGEQFVMPRIRVTYHGDESETFVAGVWLAAVGPSGRTYQDFSDSCGVIDDGLPYNELFEGGTVEGDWCVAVEEDDAGALALLVGGGGSTGSERIFLALHE